MEKVILDKTDRNFNYIRILGTLIGCQKRYSDINGLGTLIDRIANDVRADISKSDSEVPSAKEKKYGRIDDEMINFAEQILSLGRLMECNDNEEMNVIGNLLVSIGDEMKDLGEQFVREFIQVRREHKAELQECLQQISYSKVRLIGILCDSELL